MLLFVELDNNRKDCTLQTEEDGEFASTPAWQNGTPAFSYLLRQNKRHVADPSFVTEII